MNMRVIDHALRSDRMGAQSASALALIIPEPPPNPEPQLTFSELTRVMVMPPTTRPANTHATASGSVIFQAFT